MKSRAADLWRRRISAKHVLNFGEPKKVMDHKKLSVCVTASCTWLRILLTKLRQRNCCLKPFIVLIMKTWYINYTGWTVPTSRSMMLSVVRLTFALTTKPSATENNCENATKWWSLKPNIHRRTYVLHIIDLSPTCDSIYATSCDPIGH